MRKTRQIFYICFVFVVLLGICVVYNNIEKEKNNSPVVITEVCIHNETASYDENGNYGADYVELYNKSDRTVGLLNWGLSDSNKNKRKFLFPDITIEPGQCIIVWCNEDTVPAEDYRGEYVSRDVHGVSFKLSGGERVILTDAEGSYVDGVVIPDNVPDNEVLACTLDDYSKYTVTESTPYYVSEKIQSASNSIENVDKPLFSVDGGWFESDILVEITAKEGDIYYTLDGSDPDETSIKYSGPITITNRTDEANIFSGIESIATQNAYIPDFNVDKGTVLRAVAIDNGKKSDITSKTYFVGLDTNEYEGVSIMSITASPEDLFGYENGIYVAGAVYDNYLSKVKEEALIQDYDQYYANFAKEGKGWEREAQIEYFMPDHTKVLEQNIGIRIHGYGSVKFNQKSFSLYAREEYDESPVFNYDFYQDGSSYDKLVLRNGGGNEDMYISKIRDIFNQSLVSDRNIGTQKAIPCAVFLNGEYWGLYNLQEKVSESYISQKYGVDESNVALIRTKQNGYVATKNVDLEAYNNIISFIMNNDMADHENYEKVSGMIDVQSCIDYYCLEIYTANSDAYGNNWAVWFSREKGDSEYEDCRLRWLAYDLDITDNLIMEENTADVNSFVEGNWYETPPLSEDNLFSHLIQNSEFKERFIQTFTEMAETNFSYNEVSGKLWSLAAVYRNQTIKSHERFRGDYVLDEYPVQGYEPPYDDDDYGNDIGIIDAFFRDRADYILEYMREELGGN